jgi:hypothetical protein
MAFPVSLLDRVRLSTLWPNDQPTPQLPQSVRVRISLYGFLDGSGDFDTEDRIFMCGYEAGEERWNEFSACWKHELRMSGLGENEGVHATELLSRSGEVFGRSSKTKAEDFKARLTDVIRSTLPVGIAVGFDARHYRTFSEGQRGETGQPLAICMARSLDIAFDIVGEMMARGDQVAGINFTFDDSEKDAVRMLRAWIQVKKARPALVDAIPSVGFADDKRFYPVTGRRFIRKSDASLMEAGLHDDNTITR